MWNGTLLLGWRYIIPNPLFPFIAFRLGLPGNHPALRYEMISAVQSEETDLSRDRPGPGEEDYQALKNSHIH